MQPFEIVDHTAEMGIRAYGRSREELFAHMAQGMFSLIVQLDQISPTVSRRVEACAKDWDELLVAWLRELLYLFDTEHFLASSFQIERLDPQEVQATIRGEKLDVSRHTVGQEVKAVTYCDLQISQTPEGIWTAQVIFDV